MTDNYYFSGALCAADWASAIAFCLCRCSRGSMDSIKPTIQMHVISSSTNKHELCDADPLPSIADAAESKTSAITFAAAISSAPGTDYANGYVIYMANSKQIGTAVF